MASEQKYLCSACSLSLSPVEAAKAEIRSEDFDAEVERHKQKLKEKKPFFSFIPFKIVRR